jgi:hypothetical protein
MARLGENGGPPLSWPTRSEAWPVTGPPGPIPHTRTALRILLACCVLLAFHAAPVAGQVSPPDAGDGPRIRSAGMALPAAPVAEAGAADGSTERLVTPAFPGTTSTSRRSPWLLPGVGAVVGGLAGLVLSEHVMRTADDWVAPPVHIVLVPAGVVLGAFIGFMGNQAFPSNP